MKLRSERSATKVEAARRRPAGPGRPQARRIAIDGPVASGKSAVGSRVAQRLGYRFIDTGAMYRAFTWLALERGVDPDDGEGLARLAQGTEMTVEAVEDAADRARVTVDGADATPHLRSSAVEAAVSLISTVPAVREALVAIQQDLAQGGRVVMAGRDIGTVVLPDAELKVYLEASPDERAKRRREELRAQGAPADLQQVRDELARRDAIDSGRAVSPLRPADDAVIIDTDGLTLDEVIERVLALMPCHS